MRTAGWVLGFAGALFFGTSCLLAAAETSESVTKDAPAAKSSKSKPSADSKSKAWKSQGYSESKGQTKHRPRPFVDLKNSAAVAAAVDKMILENLSETGTTPAAKTSDEDFLRRVHFDLAGTVPLPREVTLFGLDPDPDKRIKLIDRLLAGDEYSHNWAGYWRDVIFLRATDMKARLRKGSLRSGCHSRSATIRAGTRSPPALLTATGEVADHGETALIFAHAGQADEIAAEASRIFLGIQIQCANCHDHPNDKWKRQQFHQLAAFFPRVQVKRDGKTKPPTFSIVSYQERPNGRGKGKGKGGGFLEHPERLFMRFDRNRDGKITRNEVKGTPFEKQFDRLLALADANKDGALHDQGNQGSAGSGRRETGDRRALYARSEEPLLEGDEDGAGLLRQRQACSHGAFRRRAAAHLGEYITSADDPWFSRAFVNRIWAEMLGEGFYMPIDDMGPQRQARMPEVLDLLADAFVANKYDMQWLFRTIARTETYQREIRAKDPSVESPPVFAASSPKRLRADQLFNAITKVLGIEGADPQATEPPRQGKNRYARRPAAPVRLFVRLRSVDQPGRPDRERSAGSVHDELGIDQRTDYGEGKTRLLAHSAGIPGQQGRDPRGLRADAGPRAVAEGRIDLPRLHQGRRNRHEGFEDVMWSLMNSSEFLSKR